MRVMIVEDQTMIRSLLESYFRAEDGYRITASIPGAKQAVEVCRTSSVDLILMDVQTENRENGLTAVRQIKAIQPKSKIIVVTSLIDCAVLDEAKRAGAGKSGYAQRLALELSDCPVYMATSRVWDEEYRKRIERHQRDRGPQWTNIEEEKALSKHHLQGRVIVIDCVTLWGTNFFFDQDSNVDLALQELKEEFDRFTAQEATFIFVTNEIGMGGVAENTIQRRFTDMQGWVNQYIAEKADEVVLMVSGIGVKVKG